MKMIFLVINLCFCEIFSLIVPGETNSCISFLISSFSKVALCTWHNTTLFSAYGHKWTMCTISIFVDIVHCRNMKLSFSLIHNTIVYAYDIFINATTRRQISVYLVMIVICLLVAPTWKRLYPHFSKCGGTKKFYLFVSGFG